MGLMSTTAAKSYTDRIGNAYDLAKPNLGSNNDAVAGTPPQAKLATVRNAIQNLLNDVVGITNITGGSPDLSQEVDFDADTNALLGHTGVETYLGQFSSTLNDINGHCSNRGKLVSASIIDIATFLGYYNGGAGGAKFSAMVSPSFAAAYSTVINSPLIPGAAVLCPAIHPLQPLLNTGFLSAILITNGGSGYTSAPTVTITGGGGSGAAATAVISAGQVVAVNITAGGTLFTTPPTITFSGGAGANAAAVSVINGATFGMGYITVTGANAGTFTGGTAVPSTATGAASSAQSGSAFTYAIAGVLASNYAEVNPLVEIVTTFTGGAGTVAFQIPGVAGTPTVDDQGIAGTVWASVTLGGTAPGGGGGAVTASGGGNNPYASFAPLPVPPAPTLTPGTGQSMTAGNYGVQITLINGMGETVASQIAIATVATNGSLTVTSPAQIGDAQAYKVYMTTANGSTFALQNGANGTQIGTNYVQNANPSGSTVPPTSSTALRTTSQTIAAQSRQTITLTAGSAANANTVGIIAGSMVTVNQGLPDQEVVVVESVVSGTSITAVFQKAHASGAVLSGNYTYALGASTPVSRRLRSLGAWTNGAAVGTSGTNNALVTNGHTAGAVRVVGAQDRSWV